MESYLPYVIADADYYDSPARATGGTRLGPAASPEGWASADEGPWRVHRAPGRLPPAGWKVHVSATPARAGAVVDAVLAICTSLGVTCKHLRSTGLVAVSQGKYADVRSSGKVLTAYPGDPAVLARLVDALSEALAGEPGARVVGDVFAVGAPVGVRFGAFGESWLVDDAGAARPALPGAGAGVEDRRGPRHPSGPDEVRDEPPVVAELRARRLAHDRAHLVDISDPRVLHRSNAGGVYSATWPDGRRVVLKEARHHTGFDAAGVDAATRLRHEWSVLRRLAGTGIAPEPVAHLTRGDSDFLVMEHVDGPSLLRRSASDNPAVAPSASRAGYDAWVESCTARLAGLLVRLHGLGVVHRDLHPANVVECGERLVLIDFESAALDGVTVGRGVQNPLVPDPDDTTPEADLSAADRLIGLLLSPHFLLTARRPGLAPLLLADARGERVVDAGPEPDPEATVDRLLAGIAHGATPEREDRLFPGDIGQFTGPHGGLGLLHGAAGVLLAHEALDRSVPSRWRDWLADGAARALDTPVGGLADGLHGVALALARTGREELAALVARSLLGGPATRAPWWAGGTSGQALAEVELGTTLGLEAVREHGLALARDTAQRVLGGHVPGHRPGLLSGWSGVALALLRVAELSPHGGDADRLVEAARVAVERERELVVVADGGVWARDGGRLMPYLGVGSGALGLAAAALDARDEASDEPSGRSSDADLRSLADGVAVTAAHPGCAFAGLVNGRAGQCLTLAALAPGHPGVLAHRRRLEWWEVPARGAEGIRLVLGDQLLRCSADLATGAAGVAIAQSGDQDGLARVLLLPRIRAERLVGDRG